MSVPTVELDLRASRRIAGALAALHGASAVLVWQLPLAGWVMAGLVAAIVIHGGWFVRRVALLRSPRSVTGFSLDRDLRCRLLDRRGVMSIGEVDDATMVTGSLVVVVVRSPGRWRRRRVVIASGMVPAEDFRCLRVLLRWGRRPQDLDAVRA